MPLSRKRRWALSPETVKDAGVRALLDANSPLRLHFEELADNLLALGEGVRSVVVTCPEAAAGCSSVCLGLGAALAGMGHPAAVVDCNLERPHLHRLLDASNFVGLTSGLEGDRLLESYGFEVSPGLLAVPTGPVPPDPTACLESEEFVEAVRGLEKSCEVVLLDAPVVEKVLGSNTLSERFDGVLLVVHASRTPKSAARDATDDLLDARVNLLGVVLNGCI